MDENVDLAAKAIERGDGCQALDDNLISRSGTKQEWIQLLQSVVDANKAHRVSDPSVPELIIVTKPDSIAPGDRIGITRVDLEQSGAPNRLVDQIYGLRGDLDLARSYDCANLEEKYRHGNLPKLR